MRTLLAILLLICASARGQEVYEIVYQIDCPTDWQDSVMALRTEPPMVLFASASHSVVQSNAPFSQCVDARIMDSPSWAQRTAHGYWISYKGENQDSALVSQTFLPSGKSKKSESILGYATSKIEAKSPGYSIKKIEIQYTDALFGVHPWCPQIKGIPLRMRIPTDLGDYVLEAKVINKRMSSDIPETPKAKKEANDGLELKENFFFDEDSTYVTVFGLISDEDNGNLLGLTEILVYEKEQVVQRTITDLRGVYDLRLKCGGTYVIEFGTAPYVRKRVQIDLLSMRPGAALLMVNLDGDLFQNPKGIDCSLLKAPIMKLHYDMNAKDMSFDEAYNASRQLLLLELKQKFN
jgi:hypothetical protein